MKYVIILLICFFNQLCFSQRIIENIFLSKILDETSGLEIVNNTFVTHNDSNNEAALYYLNTKGEIIAKRSLKGFKNIDWEDITKDETYFYLADMGNNFDTRKNLHILKIPIDTLETEPIERINFNYPEQTSFIHNKTSQFDAEGIICIDDSLIIFTKNRATKTTQIYKLPKEPGNYQAQKIADLNTQSIVTGADYNDKTKTLVLTSTIDFNIYYILILNKFTLNPKLDYSDINMYEIPIGKSQVESIKIINHETFWITSEDEKSSTNARLIKIKI